jgi:hypothetical protein
MIRSTPTTNTGIEVNAMKKGNDRQPSLFDWTPPPKVLAFPQSRRVGSIRRTAQILLGLAGQDLRAHSYRRRIYADLVRMLVERQIDEKTAIRQADEFMKAVDAEIARIRTMDHLGLGGAGGKS